MDFSSQNPNTSNALNLAARHNYYKTVNRLLKRMNPNIVDNRGWTALHEAAHRDSYESLVLILKHKHCRPMCETHEGHTALYLACRNKASLKTITLLLSRLHDIANFGSTEGVTPLHIASSQGRIELIQLLLDYGAELNVQDFDGDTPLHDAVLSVQHEAVIMLLHAGADASIVNSSGYTPFHLAASKGSLPVVNAMLPFVPEINQQTTAGHTALMLSVLGGNSEVVDFFLLHGANPYLKDIKGNMVLDIALTHGCEDIFSKIFSVTRLSEINKNIIYDACKPHYFKIKNLELLLNSNLGPEYFDFNYGWNYPETFCNEYFPTIYTSNAPLNTYLNICEYIYNSSPQLFLEFFLLFLMQGANVNALNYTECPPLVYIQYCANQNCFNSVFELLIEFGCNVDYCSFPEYGWPTECIPDAFKVALKIDPSTILKILPYSLYCDPGNLLIHAYKEGFINSLPSKVYFYLLEVTDYILIIGNNYAKPVRISIPSLQQMCRFKIRQIIKVSRGQRLKKTTEFINIINNLPLPCRICNYLRFMPIY